MKVLVLLRTPKIIRFLPYSQIALWSINFIHTMNRHKKKIIKKKKKKRKREDCTLKRIEGTEYMAFELSKEKKNHKKKRRKKGKVVKEV